MSGGGEEDKMAEFVKTNNGNAAQDLRSLLYTDGRDFLLRNNGDQVLVSELEGKMVALYFCVSSLELCREFNPKLVEIYKKLKDMGEKFEVILISFDDDEQTYKEGLESMPFLSVPFNDKICAKLADFFKVRGLPSLVIIGSDGKTLNPNVCDLVEELGIHAYPFTPEKVEQLTEIEKKRLESQTLESLLVHGERDFVIGNGGVKIPVSELVGKNILLYFSGHQCPPCRVLLPKLIKIYHEIKAKDDAFEMILVSKDSDQSSFDDYFSSMPWLALPYGDERKKSLRRTFKIYVIPSLVAIGPTGKTVTKEARELLMIHGSDAYPFTEELLKVMEARIEEMAKGWPEKVKHTLHAEHELILARRSVYNCAGCGEEGCGWSYYCEECDFDLHNKCALEEDEGCNEKGESEGGDSHGEAASKRWVCDGNVCHKA